MLEKKIKYTDYLGNEREETWWFHISDAKLTEWELSKTGGLTKMIERISETQDVPKLIELYKTLILKSVGKLDGDGRRFRQTEDVIQEFTETEAYSELYMELATVEGAGAAFVNGLVSDKLRKRMAEEGTPMVNPKHPALKY